MQEAEDYSGAADDRRGRGVLGIHLRVWGWSEFRLSIEAARLQHLLGVLAESYFYGLSLEEIVDELMVSAQGVFEDADLVMCDAVSREFELILIPCEQPDGHAP